MRPLSSFGASVEATAGVYLAGHGFSRADIAPHAVTYRRGGTLVSFAFSVEDLPAAWVSVTVGFVAEDGASHRARRLTGWRVPRRGSPQAPAPSSSRAQPPGATRLGAARRTLLAVVEETPGPLRAGRDHEPEEEQRLGPDWPGQDLDDGSAAEQVLAAVGQVAVSPRRLTMVFDPTWAGAAARAVRSGGTLASFVEEMHRQDDVAGIVDPDRALAEDGFDYTACTTAREAEAEIAAWQDLLHGPLPT